MGVTNSSEIAPRKTVKGKKCKRFFFSFFFGFCIYSVFLFWFFCLYFCLGVCFGSCIVPALLDLPSQLDEQGRFKLIRQQEEIEYEMRNEVRREGGDRARGIRDERAKAKGSLRWVDMGLGGVY